MKISTFSYYASLTVVTLGFYGYWIIQKNKVPYISWMLALAITGMFALVYPARIFKSSGILRAVLPVMLWVGWLTVSAFWSPDSRLTLYFVAVGFPFAFCAGYLWARNCSVWELSNFFWLQTMLFLPLVGIWLITIGDIFDATLGSVRTLLSFNLLVALPFLVWRARNRPTVLGYLLIIVSFLLLVGSGSRTAPVIAAILLIVSTVFVQRRGQPVRATLYGILVIAALPLALVIPEVRTGVLSAADRMRGGSMVLSSGEEVPQDIERLLQNALALRSFQVHPVRGGGFMSTYAGTRSAGLDISAHGLPALIGEVGLIGLMIFGALIGIFVLRTREAVKRAITQHERGFWQTCQLSMVGLLLFGLFHQVEQSAEFFVLLSYGYAARYK